MITHYLKIAIRNHSKHKAQSIISLFSLAIAFALVSLATYWIHYEQTYDSFLPDYDRIYKVAYKAPGEAHPDKLLYPLLYTHLMKNYPEVDKAFAISIAWKEELTEINNHVFPSECTEMTPEGADILDIQWLEGNKNMDSWQENEVAVSEQLAREVCGKDSPIGMKLSLKLEEGIKYIGLENYEYRIAAVFRTRPEHSNFKFNILKKLVPNYSPNYCSYYETYVRFYPKVDAGQFLQKLSADTIKDRYHSWNWNHNVLTPLKEVHYTHYVHQQKRNIRMDDVKLFAGSALLLSVCALLNYLTLFVSRLRNRGRDMALRTICGSSSRQMGMLLMVEYLLLLLGALFVSILFIELVYKDFVELSQLEIDRSILYAGCGYLLLSILILAALLSLIPILYFKHKTLRVQMETVPVPLNKNRFRIAGICIQLFISILFIFCATVMIKQIHYLVHADIHIERKNIASITVADMKGSQIMDRLRQMPMITEMIKAEIPLFPCKSYNDIKLHGFESKEDDIFYAKNFRINSDIARFYGLSMKEGDGNFDIRVNEILINETLAKQLGYSNPIGKTCYWGNIVGIVYDFLYQPPTEPVYAVALYSTTGLDINTVAFKYSGEFASCKAAIEKAFEEESIINLYDGETVYKEYLTSELNLLKLLNIITVISLLIALFGVYALILQECERQRKNIAVRKVYGAQVKDILMMFFKEYMMQVVIAAALALPIGYALMKRWLEGYSWQTNIGIEVFLGIFIGMALLVLLCIGWHVWRAANENPATAVK